MLPNYAIVYFMNPGEQEPRPADVSADTPVPAYPAAQLDRAARDDSLTGKLGVTAGLQQRFSGDPLPERVTDAHQVAEMLAAPALSERPAGSQERIEANLGRLAALEAELDVPAYLPPGHPDRPR